MSLRAGAALFVAMMVLFLLANRAAYKGYFQDDEIDNISWTRTTSLSDFAQALLTPRFLGNNFRPTGHFYFRVLGNTAKLDFPKYVAVLHVLHFANVWLLWLLLRSLGAGPAPATLGTFFFAFHMAAFDAYWKPMYVFDVLCTLFSLTCLLFYTKRRYILSFAAFWLAYKSKELAVMLPAVLAAYEYWLGGRHWRKLTPYFAVSALFGLQGVFLNPNIDNEYTLRFSPSALWTTTRFYSGLVLLIPYAGLAVAASALAVRDKHFRFGIAAMCLFFVPLLALPGRLYSPYTYLPLTGLAIAAAAVASMDRVALVGLCALAWIPWNLSHLRRNRREALAIAGENRAFVTGVESLAKTAPGLRSFIYEGAPSAMHVWGIGATVRYFFGPDAEIHASDEKDIQAVWAKKNVALLIWDEAARELAELVRLPDEPDASYIRMDRKTPIWQLGEGWYRLEGQFRWIQPYAWAKLLRPPDARQFELGVNMGPDQIRDRGGAEITVSIDGQPIGRHRFTQQGWQKIQWDLQPHPAGETRVEFRVDPEYHPNNGDTRRFGLPIAAFGFTGSPQ
jgi:hypothetical protein